MTNEQFESILLHPETMDNKIRYFLKTGYITDNNPKKTKIYLIHHAEFALDQFDMMRKNYANGANISHKGYDYLKDNLKVLKKMEY